MSKMTCGIRIPELIMSKTMTVIIQRKKYTKNPERQDLLQNNNYYNNY